MQTDALTGNSTLFADNGTLPVLVAMKDPNGAAYLRINAATTTKALGALVGLLPGSAACFVRAQVVIGTTVTDVVIPCYLPPPF